jgi:hypothetical protein
LGWFASHAKTKFWEYPEGKNIIRSTFNTRTKLSVAEIYNRKRRRKSLPRPVAAWIH